MCGYANCAASKQAVTIWMDGNNQNVCNESLLVEIQTNEAVFNGCITF